MTCFCDYEQPKFYVKSIRTARKIHRCCECYSAIIIGQKYEHVSGKWEEIDTFKTCMHCVNLRDYTVNNVPCICWSHGNLIEDCIETLREYAHELPGILFKGYRFVIAAKRQPKFKGIL